MPSTYANAGERQSGGDVNIMKIKDGANKIRPLDNIVAGWRQHGIEHPSDPEQFASVVCPGARSCPLCRKPVDAEGKQRFPISKRFAANVWDYETNSVKVLVGGPKIFDEFKAAAQVGISPDASDWIIIKSGARKQTTYQVIRGDQAPPAFSVTPDQLHSVDKYEQPASTEAIFEILEKMGIDYDALEIPSYTLDEALAVVIPYGKHKGYTIEQLVSKEQDYAEWQYNTKLEQGQLGDPIFLALQVVMEDRGLVRPLDDTLAAMPDMSSSPSPTTATTASVENISASSANMVELVGPDGTKVTVPPSAVESMVMAGFTKPVEAAAAAPEPANPNIKVLINGQEVELPRENAEALIASGTATLANAAPATMPEAKPVPKPPLPDEEVGVSVGGATVKMAYIQASTLVDNPAAGAVFVDSDVAEAHEASVAAGESAPDPSPTPTQSGASTSPPVPESSTSTSIPEKPFKCDECGSAYKTAGALTQHKNREHKAGVPQPSAIPANGANTDLTSRVKAKVAQSPLVRDFTQLMNMFEEVTGTRNFQHMDAEQLAKLEAHLDAETTTV